MSTISLTLPAYRSLHEGQELKFRAPGNSEDCTNLKINGTEYSFLDSLGKSVLGSPGFFVEGAMLATTVDLTNHRVYLQDSSTLHVTNDICESSEIEDTSTLDTALCSIKGGGPELIELVPIPDITDWSSGSLSAKYICYGNGKFVALDYRSVYYSTNGIDWSLGNIFENDTYDNWYSVCYGNGKFVAVTGYGYLAYSTDGINWTQGIHLDSGSGGWNCIYYGGGKFVLSGSGIGKSAYSTDGINWTLVSDENGGLSLTGNGTSICYGNNMFLAVGVMNGKDIAYSTDGITWTKKYNLPSSPPAARSWESVCYGNGMFVAIVCGETSSTFAYSSDGVNWTQGTMPSLVYMQSVYYGDGIFVIVASNSNKFAYSTDGINWTESTLPTTDRWRSVCYGNGKFVAVASGIFAYTNSNYGIRTDIIESGTQIIFRSMNSLNKININSIDYDIVYSDGSTISSSEISEGSIVSLLLDPDNNKAYLL